VFGFNIVTVERVIMNVADITLGDEFTTSPRNFGSRLPIPTASRPRTAESSDLRRY